MSWPRSKIVQGVLAVVGSIPVTLLLAYLSLPVSAAYFNHKYPHDGQNGLGVLFVAAMIIFVAPIPAAVGLYAVQWWLLRRKPFYALDLNDELKSTAPNDPQ